MCKSKNYLPGYQGHGKENKSKKVVLPEPVVVVCTLFVHLPREYLPAFFHARVTALPQGPLPLSGIQVDVDMMILQQRTNQVHVARKRSLLDGRWGSIRSLHPSGMSLYSSSETG